MRTPRFLVGRTTSKVACTPEPEAPVGRLPVDPLCAEVPALSEAFHPCVLPSASADSPGCSRQAGQGFHPRPVSRSLSKEAGLFALHNCRDIPQPELQVLKFLMKSDVVVSTVASHVDVA